MQSGEKSFHQQSITAAVIGAPSVTLALRIRQLRAAGFSVCGFRPQDVHSSEASQLAATIALAVWVSGPSKHVKPYEVGAICMPVVYFRCSVWTEWGG